MSLYDLTERHGRPFWQSMKLPNMVISFFSDIKQVNINTFIHFYKRKGVLHETYFIGYQVDTKVEVFQVYCKNLIFTGATPASVISASNPIFSGYDRGYCGDCQCKATIIEWNYY